jgi:hypothetical protein
MGQLIHPNVHTEWSSWSEDQTLHVVAAYINPFRYRVRRELFNDFAHHMRNTPNVRLHIVEVAYGDRPFEVSTPEDIQLRSNHVMWHKENAINIAIQRFPHGWKYGAYVDADFYFTRHDWALEAIHKLQHYPWVQLYSSYAHMGPDHRPLQVRPSFAFSFHNYFGGKAESQKLGSLANIANYGDLTAEIKNQIRDTGAGATGGGWAFTKESFVAVGGMLEACVMGASDWYMAFGLVGNSKDGHPEAVSCGRPYEDAIRRWQRKAFSAVKGAIGYVDAFCTHAWHGDYTNRGYGERWKVLRDHNFDPSLDITKDWQGLLCWTGNKPQLEADVNKHFMSRSEDSTSTSLTPMI